jgi:hypothetical protein
MRIVRLAAFASAIVAFALAGHDAAAQSHKCATVVDPTERLACYDEAFPPAAGVRTATLDREARRQEALRDFGLSKVQKAERDPEQYDVGPERIEATVTKVTYRHTGERVVTLDNGQIWMVTEVTEKGWFKAGDRVTVQTAMLGTFMLDTGRILLRVRRIQ